MRRQIQKQEASTVSRETVSAEEPSDADEDVVVLSDGTVRKNGVGNVGTAHFVEAEKPLERDETSTGEEVTVTWGKELFSPKPYNTFEVGPFSTTTVIRAGETRGEAINRAMRELSQQASSERAIKAAEFLAALARI